MKKTLSLGLAALLASACLTGCGNDSSKTESSSGKVSVTGDVGSKPTISVKAPLKLTKSSTEVLTKGDGATVEQGKPYVLNLTLADGSSGKTVVSTYDKGQKALGLTAGQGQIFPAVEKAAIGKKVGTRILVQAAPADAYGDNGNESLGIKKDTPVVIVADISGAQAAKPLDGPDGDKVPAKAGEPTVVAKGDTPTGITVSGKKPSSLKVTTLVKGSGEKVTAGRVITVNYFGTLWGGKTAFDQSYTRGEPTAFPIGVGSVVPCWDQGLDGVTVGSRVVLTCPPSLAYGAQGSPPKIPGNSTLTFVVDVLAVG